MKKILFFVQDGVGGAERMSALIGRELDSHSNDVCFCLIKRPLKSTITDFIPKHINRTYITGKNGLLCLFAMIWTIIRQRPSFIFSSVFNLNTKLLLSKIFFPGKRFIIRCDNYLYTYTPRQRKLLAYTYPKADKIIAQTEEMRDELVNQVGIDSTKVIVLHNPIDTKTIEKKLSDSINPYPDDGKKHIVAVGRFNPQKGFDMLADAFLKICDSRSDIELYIVGDNSIMDGKIHHDISLKFKKKGKINCLHCVGYKDNPYSYIKYADCFVLSSRWEGLPNVLIESLYLETPVAAFKCIPIIERIVRDGIDGCLAEKDDVSSLSDAIIGALKIGKVKMSYTPTEIKDFIELFNIE